MKLAKTIYNKKEYVFMEVPMSNKFYFYQQFPCIVLDALFGESFTKFSSDDNEHVSIDEGTASSDVEVVHV